jgi:hypothetical protein
MEGLRQPLARLRPKGDGRTWNSWRDKGQKGWGSEDIIARPELARAKAEEIPAASRPVQEHPEQDKDADGKPIEATESSKQDRPDDSADAFHPHADSYHHARRGPLGKSSAASATSCPRSCGEFSPSHSTSKASDAQPGATAYASQYRSTALKPRTSRSVCGRRRRQT